MSMRRLLVISMVWMVCVVPVSSSVSRFEYPPLGMLRSEVASGYRPIEPTSQTHTLCLSYTTPQSVMPAITTLFKGCQAAVHEPSRCLILRGPAEELDEVAKWIANVDREVPVLRFDVQILEVFSENAVDHDHILKQLADQVAATYSPKTGQVNVGGNLTVLLNALARDGKARLLANPQIVTMHGQSAALHVGDRVPYATTVATSQSTSTKIEFLDTGISLTITPTYVTANVIQADLVAEFISAKWTAESSVAVVPVLSTRQAKTMVQLKAGQPLTIAGLINTQEKSWDENVLGFSSLPIIGPFFSAGRRQNSQSDVVFIIRPLIIGGLASPPPPAEPDGPLRDSSSQPGSLRPSSSLFGRRSSVPSLRSSPPLALTRWPHFVRKYWGASVACL